MIQKGSRTLAEVSFSAGAEAYDRFMGRYSGLLAPRFVEFAGVERGQRVIDVGCGPGALTAELIERLGVENISAVDPSAQFADAAGARNPGLHVERAAAEQLPFEDDSFDAALAQLVVHFMADPVKGISEMRRVTTEDGAVAACVWDHGGGQGPLSLFWETARALDPDVEDESQLAGARDGHLAELFGAAGMRDIEQTSLRIEVEHPSFEEWWERFLLGVGPAGSYAVRLDAARQARLREACRERLPDEPFAIPAQAWAARGSV